MVLESDGYGVQEGQRRAIGTSSAHGRAPPGVLYKC
jgi:hypothetical protein